MDILLIRHGQSEADLLDVHEGRADFDLTPLGVRQAELLADWVKAHHRPDIIWSSTLQRALHVAELLSAETAVPIRADERLMEFNNGFLAGMPREEARRQYPEPVQGRRPHERIPGGESEIEFRARVEAVFSEIVDAAQGLQTLAVISHGGTISMCINAFLQLPLVTTCRFTTGDTGCHLLSLHGGQRVIRFMNRQDHLVHLGVSKG